MAQTQFSPASIQRLQMFNLLSLMFIGKIVLNFPITWLQIVIIIGFSVFIEHLIIFIKQKHLDFFSYSAVNTALGVVFLMRSVELYVFFVVITLALLTKHYLKIDSKHFLNPSNVAVVSGLALFPYYTYTTPEQWGSFWWLGVLMMALGLFITQRVGRAMIPLVFMAGYALMSYLFLTHNLFDIALTLISGSFLLFMLFMLTDPRTTPEKSTNQVLFALVIAFLTITFELLWGVKEINMFLALFLLSFAVPLLRRMDASRWYSQALLAVALIMATSGLYFSNYNTIRNLEQTTMPTAPIITPEKKEMLADTITSNPSEANATLYKTHWERSHVVSLAFVKNKRSDTAFEKRSDLFTTPMPPYERKHMGWEFMHHAAVTSGDINHDGKLDIISAKSVGPIQIWLNTDEGNFSDSTATLFESDIPKDVDIVALADMNNDSWQDLIVLSNRYASPKSKQQLYLFDPDTQKFKPSFEFAPAPVGISGSVAIHDLNHDKLPDVYIVYSRDWHAQERKKGFLRSHGLSDQLWVSGNGSWQEQLDTYLPIGKHAFAGMTALFTDFDGDGNTDFMLGNDVQPSVTMLGDANGSFHLIPKERIQYNAGSSMSYFSIDFNNDGIFELWENCISTSSHYKKNRFKDTIGQPQSYFDDISVKFEQMRGDVRSGHIDCHLFKGSYLEKICEEKVAFYRGSRLADPKACQQIQNLGQRIYCETLLNTQLSNRYDPREAKFDAEKFPQSVNYNIALMLNGEGKYTDAIVDEDARFSGWSWAAYPYDIDNDGRQDLFVSTGAEISLHRIPNALLINKTLSHTTKETDITQSDSDEAVAASGGGSIRFKNLAKEYELANLEDSRGVIVADFDMDGDGDIFVNQIFKKPLYYENNLGGEGISVELRSKNSNYYALGSRLELHTNKGIQTREIRIGGVWDSAQPVRQHFGLSWQEEIKTLKIRWPDGHTQDLDALEKNRLYIIYE